MPALFQYLIKLSCSLLVVLLFYQMLLRKLTFYNLNRWYLLLSSALCFLIPLINISGLLERHQLNSSGVVRLIPAIGAYTDEPHVLVQKSWLTSLSAWDVCLLILIFGSCLLLARLLVQCLSYRRIRKNAQRLTGDRIAIYGVSKNISPFSFGNAIFINQQLHSETELKEIIRHEFVHVKQHHTIDILWAEIVCILNWYNPAAWLLRHAVRQNLEFIADNSVIESGVNKKEYQYLLLNVMGAQHFRVAASFNFSSLKKRIVMMNKSKSARAHLVKFILVLPVVVVLLVAFRNATQTQHEDLKKFAMQSTALKDTTPAPPPPPVVTPSTPVAVAPEVPAVGLVSDTSFLPDDYNDFQKRNPTVRSIEWTEQNIIILFKSGKKETYLRNDAKILAAIEKKYGELPVAPPPPPPMVVPPAPPTPLDSAVAAQDAYFQKLALLQNHSDQLNDSVFQKLELLRNHIDQLNDSVRSTLDSKNSETVLSYLAARNLALQKEQKALQQYLIAQQDYLKKNQLATQERLREVQQKLQQRHKAMQEDQKASYEYLKKMQEDLQKKQKALQDATDSRSSLLPGPPSDKVVFTAGASLQ